MKWLNKQSSFKYNGKPVTRHKATAQTPLGEFKVYEAVNGKTFVVHPFIKRQQFLVGFDPDPFNEISQAPRLEVPSFEYGIATAEAKWLEIKHAINEYE
jgi:hypothetical protein